MPLTPADVHNVTFKKPMLGKRGYDEDEVDGFLDEVERELIRLNEENGELRSQVENLRAGAAPGVADHAEMAAALERVQREKSAAEHAIAVLEADLEETRHQAEVALQQNSGAMQQAAAGAEGGEQQALRLLMVAQRTADDHLEDARREAETVLGEARSQSEDMVAQARSKAERLERDAQQRHQEIMGALETERATLSKYIEELKTFERDYRTRLKAYLESQLRDLDGRSREGDEPEMPQTDADIPQAAGVGGYGKLS
ncbi:DivIVA domain-containing protein [Natronoglycomyces albus]|uniref:Cell wall synthesis protein Wag31 n=1 Tax=Natronoglycomyces albus TaxID=2811108 RepID=A0A895XPP5_9ACTN|nr:DivIVA domain-containing protein [Natronoglycomyces albus]QSB04250.1 DivIVA domain-containing protein [Natronoglycomyces albus]